METNSERRRENRLRYSWPVWFAEDFDGTLTQGQMVDVSSGGAAFTCYSHDNCPYPGQEITARFSVPHFAADDSFQMQNYVNRGRVCRVDSENNFLRRIAVQFADTLPFRPGEQGDQSQVHGRLKAVTI